MFWKRFFAPAGMSLLALLAARAAEVAPVQDGLTVVFPSEDTNAVLHNPDMGWVLYENYPLDPDPHGSSTMLTFPDDGFSGVDNVALMFSWQDVETSENVFDFSRVDAAYDHWRARGKVIQLRMSTESLMFWERRNPPAGRGVPDYVLARLGADEKQTRAMEGNTYTVVDARNPFYRERLAVFLHAVNDHFDSKRPVSLVDLRGFGVWGEWHSGFRYPTLEVKHTALSGVLDIWSAQFPRHQLALSFSCDPDGPKDLYAGPYDKFDPGFATNYDEFLRYSAFDHALTKSNITFRRDGCGGAVYSNERKLNEEAFTVFRRAPMMGEFLGGYGSMKRGGTNWVTWVLQDALSLHPNYLNLIGWQGADAREFIRDRPDLFARGLREMGYRFVPTRIAYSANLTNEAQLDVRIDWVNRGVGRALRDYQITFVVADTSGKTVASSSPFDVPTSGLTKGVMYTTRYLTTLNHCPPGDYRLLFLLRDPGTARVISLPLAAGTATGGYDIGPIRKLDLSPGKRSIH